MPKKIEIPEMELWDEEKEQIVFIKPQTITIEHSLVSISKWESKWKIPFMGKTPKTTEQMLDYVRCMTINQNVNPDVYKYLPRSILSEIADYIEDSMTASWFRDDHNSSGTGEQITSELVYYWMDTLGIPADREKWHFNRLITLIRVHSAKSQKPKKMSAAERAALNKSRRAKLGTKG